MTHRHRLLSCLLLLLFTPCVLSQVLTDPYCLQNSSSGLCAKCINFFYLKDGRCTQVSPSCNTYNNTTGSCLSCVEGFSLKEGRCEGSGRGSVGNVGAAEIHIGLPKDTKVNQYAKTQNVGALPGVLTNLSLVVRPVLAPVLVSSAVDSSANQINLMAFPSTLPPLTSLPPVPVQNTQNGLNHQNSGQQNGFIFFGGSQETQTHHPSLPVVSTPDHSVTTTSTTTTTTTTSVQPSIEQDNNPYGYPPEFMDPYCQQYSPSKRCLVCANRFFFNLTSGLCSPVDPQCNTFDNQGSCTSCYPGYSLTPSGNCSILSPQTSTDPNCRTLDQHNTCLSCYPSFILTNGRCLPVNPQCKDYNRQTGQCTDCYAGYTLKEGQCIVTPQNVVNTQDLCKERGGVNNLCISCFGDNSVVNGICVPSLTLCQSIDSQSNCLSCYSGYSLLNGRCRLSDSSLGCSRFSPIGTCLQCSKGYYLQDKLCKPVNPLCKSFNQLNGGCQSCYPGYSLIGGNCLTERVQVSDPNCFEMRDGVCVVCSNRFVKIDGKCTPVNDYCNTYDMVTGDCTSCYGGFVLRYGYCYKTLVGNSETAGQQQSANIQTAQQNQQNTAVIQTQSQTQTQTDESVVIPSIGQQLFYEWLHKDTPGYLFSTQNNQGSLSLDSGSTNTQAQTQISSSSILTPLTPSLPTTQSSLRTDSSSTTVSLTSPPSQPLTLPVSSLTSSTSSISSETLLHPIPAHQTISTFTISSQPSPLFVNFTTTQSSTLPAKDSHCLKYGTDNVTCLECAKSWNLVEGHCLLGGVSGVTMGV